MDWTPESGLERWTTIERNCLPGFSSFGNINGCYKVLGAWWSWLDESWLAWQDASDACDSLGPNVHLAGIWAGISSMSYKKCLHFLKHPMCGPLTFDIWPWALILTHMSFHLTFMPEVWSTYLSVWPRWQDTQTNNTCTDNAKTTSSESDMECNEGGCAIIYRTPSISADADQCQSKYWHLSGKPLNANQCWSLHINATPCSRIDRQWSAFIGIDWQWLVLIGIGINATILIGIDRHWAKWSRESYI